VTDQAGTDWFILRTAGRSTLPLAKTLAEDGFEVWTPVRTQTIRVPRMNVRREVKLPLLPSFVFVRAPHLCELLELANMAEKPRRGTGWGRPAHRDFSVFHYLDRIPILPDIHLEPLRYAERKAIPRKDAPRFDRGAKVRANAGVFEGMHGKVERCRSGKAIIVFEGGSKRWEIPTFLLSETEAICPPTVARAA
jgi:transcription antitermination factor NusG